MIVLSSCPAYVFFLFGSTLNTNKARKSHAITKLLPFTASSPPLFCCQSAMRLSMWLSAAVAAVCFVAVCSGSSAAEQPILLPLEQFPHVRVVQSDTRYAEGVIVAGDDVVYTEYIGNRLNAYNTRTRTTRLMWRQLECGLSAALLRPASASKPGGWLVTCYDTNTVLLLDATAPHAVLHTFTGTTAIASEQQSAESWNGPNDLVSDGRGGVFVSASGKFDLSAPIAGCLYHISSEDWAVRRVTDCNLHYANGWLCCFVVLCFVFCICIFACCTHYVACRYGDAGSRRRRL